ncbi:MAG: outer membrane protein assembly factor BamA [Planctomycetales bacterium]|nr:outer membrane protein assembly factor BamA [Planctomycetales bacterium]
MRGARGAIAFAALILSAAPALAQAPAGGGREKPEGDTIAEIVIRGRSHRPEGEIRARMKTREGRALDTRVIEEDVKRLGREGIFARYEWDPGSRRLTLHLDERPPIRSISVTGVSVLTEDDVREALAIRTDDPLLDLAMLEVMREGVRRAYRRKGHRFADVRVTAEPQAGGVALLVKIHEGPATSIDEILFRGVHAVAEGELRDELTTETGSFFKGSKVLDDDTLALDAARVETAYRMRGFLDARATIAPLRYSDDLEEVTATIVVEEGPRYAVAAVSVEGAKAVPTPEILAEMDLAPGEAYDGRLVLGDRARALPGDIPRIQELYAKKGYPFARVEIEHRIPKAGTPAVDVIVHVDEGPKARVGRLDIYGNRVTREDVIRREIPLAPGDPLDMEELRKGYLRLYQTQLFKNIEPRFRETSDPEVRDVVLDVSEAETTGEFQFGGSYSQNAGFAGQILLTIRNFDLGNPSPWPWDLFVTPHWRGGGQTLRFVASAGSRSENYAVDFLEPWLFGTRNYLDLNTHIRSLQRPDHTVRREGATLTMGRNLSRVLSVRGLYTLEWIEHRNVEVGALPEVIALDEEGRELLSKAGLGAGLDFTQRDRAKVPYGGFELDAIAEYAGGPLGGRWNFWTLGTEVKIHQTLLGEDSEWRHIVTARARVDYGRAHSGDADVPYFERYFAGGWGTIRGFDFRDVGPRVNGDPVGGDFLVTGSVEYSIPLYRDSPYGAGLKWDLIRIVAFFDAAAIASDFQDYSSESWRTSIGFGFRLRIPGFPLEAPFALDFAWPLGRRAGDETEVISFNFDLRFS